MPRALNHALAPIAKQVIGKDWAIYSGLLDHWPEIVGQSYAQTTTPVKITFPHQPQEPRRRGGTLTIRLPKGLAMEFTYKISSVQQRVNNYFGYDAVGKIVLETVYALPAVKNTSQPSPQAIEKAKEASDGIENSELREALEKLGGRILGSVSGEKTA